ncbi:tetratricopeptide repeat protein [Terrisporobacter mayombei]|uniref:Molecular chaperone DnaJ n=1 Tax=Terrisporobacter mayombei TaxID=1541 RepID=A0ABY9Q5J8_9FIRM|nr:CDC27 family protein [Terrisporobacter mayombei]MCC3870096.1 hypothetical protein [Terrisporobacter mayombei]WMT82330.1 hypothetical protein TEMA_27010 [Terrisporobacter mayombei]
MYSNVYENDCFMKARRMIENKDFKRAYNFLQSINEKCSEWYYLTGLSAMNIGYYEEGEDFLKRAKFMDPNNKEYVYSYNRYNNYRNDYDRRSYNYNRNRRYDSPGCCCCCCDDDCCSNLCTLYVCDSCCECCGGDLCTCF